MVGSVEGDVFGTTIPAFKPHRSKRAWALAGASLALIVAVTGCGSSRHPVGAAAGAPDTIVIRNFAFEPSTLAVAAGTKVTVRNTDPATHTVTSTGGSQAFDTGDIPAGATVTFTAPTTSGSYSYICHIHQFMHGTLQVR